MKKIVLLFALTAFITASACKKDKADPNNPGGITGDLPRTSVPAELRASWMYGNFSTTEYWNQNPNSYIGNALEFAIAFKFEENGTYTHYFTSSSYLAGAMTYQQSVTKGTVEVDVANKVIKTHPLTSHYKRTRNNQVQEERDLTKEELNSATTYKYTSGKEANGTRALYLTLNGTTNPLTFLEKK
jgi:hypothetical protein